MCWSVIKKKKNWVLTQMRNRRRNEELKKKKYNYDKTFLHFTDIFVRARRTHLSAEKR